jgi:ABC-type phosphate transport system substrate-binding protein
MRIPLYFLLMLALPPAYADSRIAIVTHKGGAIDSLTRKQVADIYMGRGAELRKHPDLLVLDYQGDSKLRERFYLALTGKSLPQINAYWARLAFSGQANPPRRMTDEAAVLQSIKRNPDVLGYVDFPKVSDDVAVALTLE